MSEIYTQNFIDNGVKINDSLLDKERAKRKDNLFFLLVSAIALVLMALVVFLNTYVFFIAEVSQSSMEPTLFEGDSLVTNRYKQPKIDSIIIIKHEQNGKQTLWIKRVVALGGDTVEIKNGKVFVNGKLKEEPYLASGVITEDRDNGTKWVLAEDEVFYLGDNRAVSDDSRTHGPCKQSDVVGVVEEWSLWLKKVF